MSDNITSFIPVEPSMVANDQQLRAVEEYLTSRYAGSTEIQVNKAYEKPFFIDAGENHESIKCPRCLKEVPIPEWQDVMTRCWDETSRGFDLKGIKLSCCGNDVAPNELVYSSHQGFAMVSFEVTNPKETDHQPTLQFLKVVFGVDFKIINARY